MYTSSEVENRGALQCSIIYPHTHMYSVWTHILIVYLACMSGFVYVLFLYLFVYLPVFSAAKRTKMKLTNAQIANKKNLNTLQVIKFGAESKTSHVPQSSMEKVYLWMNSYRGSWNYEICIIRLGRAASSMFGSRKCVSLKNLGSYLTGS